MDDKDKEIINRQFIDYFQMTIDEFDNLEFNRQEELIRKALLLRKKQKKLELKMQDKDKLEKVFSHLFNKDYRKSKK